MLSRDLRRGSERGAELAAALEVPRKGDSDGSVATASPAAFFMAHFPFHFLLDSEGRVLQAGEALARLEPALRRGRLAGDVLQAFLPFAEQRPLPLDSPAGLYEASRGRAVLLRLGSGLEVKGQFLPPFAGLSPGGEAAGMPCSSSGDAAAFTLRPPPRPAALFLGTPFAHSLDLPAFGLSLADFPAHDLSRDFVLAAHARAIAVAAKVALEAQRAAEALLAELQARLAAARTEADILHLALDGIARLCPAAGEGRAIATFHIESDPSSGLRIANRAAAAPTEHGRAALWEALEDGVAEEPLSSVHAVCSSFNQQQGRPSTDSMRPPCWGVDSGRLQRGVAAFSDWAAAVRSGVESGRARTMLMAYSSILIGFVTLHFPAEAPPPSLMQPPDQPAGSPESDAAAEARLLEYVDSVSAAIFTRRVMAGLTISEAADRKKRSGQAGALGTKPRLSFRQVPAGASAAQRPVPQLKRCSDDGMVLRGSDYGWEKPSRNSVSETAGGIDGLATNPPLPTAWSALQPTARPAARQSSSASAAASSTPRRRVTDTATDAAELVRLDEEGPAMVERLSGWDFDPWKESDDSLHRCLVAMLHSQVRLGAMCSGSGGGCRALPPLHT